MRSRWLLVLILVGGGLARLAFVAQPVDYRTTAPWREADYVQIARAFYLEDPNPLRPRVHWREETSGEVEMELPVIPWTASVLYRVFGYREQLLRVLVALAAIGSLLAFARLSRKLLPPVGSLFATGLFAFNGLLIGLSASVQPESLQILLSILAVAALVSWRERDRPGLLLLAGGMTGLAILAKAPAASLGLVLAYFVLKRYGLRALTRASVYGSAALALLPPLAWYVWAHGLFQVTGLSLGLSDETHLLNWEVLRRPRGLLVGNLVHEGRHVFAIAGIPLAATALAAGWRRVELPFVWLAAVGSFYLISGDTSGDGWAYYYHCSSIPAACLLMGAGFGWLLRAPRTLIRTAVAAYLALATVMLQIVFSSVLLELRQNRTDLRELYHCSREFAHRVPAEARVATRGGRSIDAHGHPTSYRESMVLSWLDRHGFVYPLEASSLEAVAAIRDRGGDYWLALPQELGSAELRKRAESLFTLVDRCGGYTLFDLRGTP